MFLSSSRSALSGVLVSCVCLVLQVGIARAQVSSSAVNEAKRFLSTRGSGEYILSFAHFGATYKGHEYVELLKVSDKNGREIPGEFALVYDYTWDAGGVGDTRLAFLCDKSGKVEDVQVLSSTGVIQTPFKLADATIQILGRIMTEAFKDQMNTEDKKQIDRLVASADSEALLEVGLTLRQSLGIR